MYICICNISYKLTQKHIAWCKFFTIFKERKIERKKKKQEQEPVWSKEKKNKQNYTVLLYYKYLYIMCTY